MKIFIIAIIMACITVSSCHTSVAKNSQPLGAEDTGIHTMMHTDASTIYFDTAGNKIEAKQFAECMQSGKYTVVPDIKDGKLLSVKLKPSEQKITMGSLAPEFSGTDLTGKSIDLKALKGKTVILNFWFAGCAPCRAEMPELNNLVDKYKDDNSVVFVAITYDPTEQAKAFLKRKDFKFIILAGRSDIIDQYGITSYPTSMVIDKSGNVTFSLTTYDGTNVAQLDGVISALKKCSN
ncbi:MAG: TlpA disulfide reductase family protein [Flavipsychrobacter sp.]|nr:TlpA disulfide reductase family protein [Flavipsychrobacter sp.]